MKTENSSKRISLVYLFLIMLKLSLFTFGGGYVIVSLMKKKFVDQLNWIEEEEMLNLVSIAQSSPGAVAVNGAILVGYKIAGIKGAIISIIATILPPFFIIYLLSNIYDSFRDNLIVSSVLFAMQAGVAAIILDVVINLSRNIIKQKNVILIILMILSFFLSYFLKVNIIYIIILSGFIGVMHSQLRQLLRRN